MVASAGAAVWAVPEILTAKPAAGAALSITTHGGGGGGGGDTGNSGSNGGNSGGGSGDNDGGVTTNPAQTPATEVSTSSPASTPGSGSAPVATTPAKSLAFTGIDLQRDAEIGAALIAGGWAMHHWASRRPKAAVEGAGQVDEAGSADTPT
ncbi:MAG TPA: hypothetical protein VHS57_00260 [Acidimicrobiales bacterium]|jgi:hypothetical protein|nr:hypothetical protein [Acidimicrobiales bacterium]